MLERSDGTRQSAVTEFPFVLGREDREQLRWYLEDYLEYPVEPAPQIASGVERRMAQLGIELSRRLFEEQADAREIWGHVRRAIHRARVEVVSEPGGTVAIPWELLRAPNTGAPLAFAARAFVRAQPREGAGSPERRGTDRLRVLLVICRPAGPQDVPFRSVASHLARLSRRERAAFELDVLRPPTFEQLKRTLTEATTTERPYDVVHFDGHGVHGVVAPDPAKPWFELLGEPSEDPRGYLEFEHPHVAGKVQLADGALLGALLAQTEVPLLVLNACRSAYAEAPIRPDPEDPVTAEAHARVRAYASLAEEVVHDGVPGVVAMSYNVWVVTATQFVGRLYSALLAGAELGEAVNQGRRELAAQPQRTIASDTRPLQDWMVPVVYEAAPLAPFTRRPPGHASGVTVQERGRALRVPAPPDSGFFGRDETLLALDRAFDRRRTVLLHAFAGAGKTAAAIEFARWYQHTGGLDAPEGPGPVLFTSFAHHTSLSTILNRLAETFDQELRARGIEWDPLAPDDERQGQITRVLDEVPVLWIWDNVEPVAGFPTGAASTWSEAEQRALVRFLGALSTTRARVLLTSRRDEQGWLGQLPLRVSLLRMPLRESLQLATSVIERARAHRFEDTDGLRLLLRYAAGNPLTIKVLVSQVLREQLTTREQIERFVERVRLGEADLTGDDGAVSDDIGERRATTLRASLEYGFTSAFDEDERTELARLHLFQDYVWGPALVSMRCDGPAGSFLDPEALPLHTAAGRLLDRAAEVGLLTFLGRAYYGIHPALPWFLGGLFRAAYGPSEDPRAQTVIRSYVAITGDLGNAWYGEWNRGRSDVTALLELEEANLLHARDLARTGGLWDDLVSCMQGLRALYTHTGRMAEWSQLVEELVPDLVDPETHGPRPGRERHWAMLTDYRARLALEARNWPLAERLHRASLDWARDRAREALTAPPDQLDESGRASVHSLANALTHMGDLLLGQRREEAVAHYEEAAQLYPRTGDRRGELAATSNLGGAYIGLVQTRHPAQLDEAGRYRRGFANRRQRRARRRYVDMADRCFRRALDLSDEDSRDRAAVMGMLGVVAYMRFMDARAAREPDAIIRAHRDDATAAYLEALRLTPPDDVALMASSHSHLADAYGAAGDIEAALEHAQEAIRLDLDSGDEYGAARNALGLAITLRDHGRLDLSQMYAESALRAFEAHPGVSPDDVERARMLLASIRRVRA